MSALDAAVAVAVAVGSGQVPGELGDLAVDSVEPGEGGGVVGQGTADRGDHAGQLGQLAAERGVVGGLAGVEVGGLLAAGREHVQCRGEGIGGHGQLHGNERSSWPEAQPGGR
jgi:hypothetical protein